MLAHCSEFCRSIGIINRSISTLLCFLPAEIVSYLTTARKQLKSNVQGCHVSGKNNFLQVGELSGNFEKNVTHVREWPGNFVMTNNCFQKTISPKHFLASLHLPYIPTMSLSKCFSTSGISCHNIVFCINCFIVNTFNIDMNFDHSQSKSLDQHLKISTKVLQMEISCIS